MAGKVLNQLRWLAPFLAQWPGRPGPDQGQSLTICLAVVDHFEPFGGGRDKNRALERLAAWERELPPLAAGVADSRGRPYRHTFFYPLEEYDPEVLDRLARLRQLGVADVEVHLHHHGESSSELSDKLTGFAALLRQRHDLLRDDAAGGRPAYGFVHGDWALDNSHPDGIDCGVNDELRILGRTGCYADFTLPSAPSPTQTRTINSIYYATDDPERPKSHDRGRPARVGVAPSGDLLLVQGVLALSRLHSRRPLLPRVENSELAAYNPPDPERLPLWLRYAPVVQGAESVRFIKLHCHGALEVHRDALLGPPARRLWEHLAEGAQKGLYRLAFCSCWEMVGAIHALERGEEPF